MIVLIVRRSLFQLCPITLAQQRRQYLQPAVREQLGPYRQLAPAARDRGDPALGTSPVGRRPLAPAIALGGDIPGRI